MHNWKYASAKTLIVPVNLHSEEYHMGKKTHTHLSYLNCCLIDWLNFYQEVGQKCGVTVLHTNIKSNSCVNKQSKPCSPTADASCKGSTFCDKKHRLPLITLTPLCFCFYQSAGHWQNDTQGVTWSWQHTTFTHQIHVILMV